MRPGALATLLLFLSSPLFAQNDSSTTPAGPAAASSDLVRLGGQVLLAGKTYEYDRVLADEIGPRLTGSANYNKAVDWAAGEFERIGLSNVHREGWEIAASWEPEIWATGRILVP